MNALFEALGQADRGFVKLQKVLLAILSILVTISMGIEVVTRFVLQSPLFGLEEITLICMMWLYMIGAIMASQQRSHLTAEMVDLLVKDRRLLTLVKSAATLITIFVAGFIVIWSYNLFIWGLEKQQGTPVFRIPWVVSQSSIFFASIMFVIYLVRDLVHDLTELRKAITR